jgi:hypothetical protein
MEHAPLKRIQKGDLPDKICTACGRPFTWRKKWVRSWDEVRFCSERCRRQARLPQQRDSQ